MNFRGTEKGGGGISRILQGRRGRGGSNKFYCDTVKEFGCFPQTET